MNKLANYKLVAVPAVSAAAGVAGGHVAYQKGKAEKKRWRRWKGKDGSMIIVRKPKGHTKNAFDEKMMLCLAATGGELENVHNAFELELQKIAAMPMFMQSLMGVGGRLIRGGAAALGHGASPGAALSKGFAAPVGAAAKTAPAAAGKAMPAAAGKVLPGGQKLTAKGQQAVDMAQANKAQAAGPLAMKGRTQAAATPQPLPAKPATPPGQPPEPAVGASPDAAQGATNAVSDLSPTTSGPEGTPPPGADGGGGMMQQMQQGINNRYNTNLGGQGGALMGGPPGVGAPMQMNGQNIGQWFGALDPKKKAEILAMMGGGAGAAGLGAGAAGSAMMGGDNVTIIR